MNTNLPINHDPESYRENQNSVEAFGRMLQSVMPKVVREGTDGDVEQVGDRENMSWIDFCWTVELSNGAEFQISVKQVAYARDDEFECERCGTGISEREADAYEGHCEACYEEVSEGMQNVTCVECETICFTGVDERGMCRSCAAAS